MHEIPEPDGQFKIKSVAIIIIINTQKKLVYGQEQDNEDR